MAQEALAGWRQFRTVAPALKQARAELGFQRVDARAHGGLRHVQAAGGGDEVAGGGDHQKGAGEFGVHVSYIGFFDIRYQNLSLDEYISNL